MTFSRPQMAEGMIRPGNIDMSKRVRVDNHDGTVSTVRSMSFNSDGVEVLIPTLSPEGKQLTKQGAIDQYRKSGQHLGMFVSPEYATRYGKQLSAGQERRQ